jgi:hypothetical protein
MTIIGTKSVPVDGTGQGRFGVAKGWGVSL